MTDYGFDECDSCGRARGHSGCDAMERPVRLVIKVMTLVDFGLGVMACRFVAGLGEKSLLFEW